MTREQIQEKLLNGEDVDIPMMPVNAIKSLLVEIGFIMEDLDDNTNGWSVGFFYYFNHSTLGRYLLSGSLWYGNFQISKDE